MIALYILQTPNVIASRRYCLVNQHDEDEGEIQEVAIVCFSETDLESSLSQLTFTMKAFLIYTSVAFLLLTLYVYYRLPELRETQVMSALECNDVAKVYTFILQDKVTIFTLINLTTFLVFLGIMQVQTPVDILHESCLALAFLVYFFTIGYFAWLNCVIANVWKTVV